ncbi:hypothetical protein FFLO_01144 [Filobasidium floriforme]|uniref:RING-type E3 ubiquitin transferase n=1 Tax=Filobasidium floriforme TaxID=5210 RepID=A0A8K0JQL5_9TREE|nr:uncharacterized protein HD553DRAFT_278563 [Filobasidium floriforme]KAG7570946.1 hypothetical protein FFLO_01144 [Filobasidium floriforme]KAH8077464.1 hypothetical protein HD553DRAFT_278563 [Filobasidium floriforme]
MHGNVRSTVIPRLTTDPLHTDSHSHAGKDTEDGPTAVVLEKKPSIPRGTENTAYPQPPAANNYGGHHELHQRNQYQQQRGGGLQNQGQGQGRGQGQGQGHGQNQGQTPGQGRSRGKGKDGPPHQVNNSAKITEDPYPLKGGVNEVEAEGEEDNKEEEENAEENDEEEEDEESCFICAEKIKYYSGGVCGHKTCHVCAIRLRVFYKKNDCTFCKTVNPTLLFSSSPDTPFPTQATPPGADFEPGQLDVKQFEWHDEKLGVVFESQSMMEDVLLLLRFNCPSPSCAYQAASWDNLEKHTLSVHGAVLCHLCRRQLSRFAHEQVLYPPHLLPLHDPSRVPRGHRAPRLRGEKEEEMVAGWGPPHPMCEFCHEAFFSSDELFKHMRHKHEECFVCKEMGKRDVYFHNYTQLASHFTQAHFPCTEKSCLDQKFVVFGSELDWKAHMVAEHNKTMSSRDKYQARQLPIDFVSPTGDFSFIPPNPMPSSGSTRDQGSSRAPRLIQMEPAGQFSRQTGRNRPSAVRHQQLPQPPRDERRGGRRAGFGNALTSDEPAANASGNKGNRAAGGASGTATPRIDEPEEMDAMQTELLERVATMVEYSETKLSSFRHAIRSYKNNEAPARDLVDTVYSVLNRDSEDTFRVVRRVADTMRGDDDKVRGILTALNAFKIDRQNEFPTLAGTATPPVSLGTGYSGIASGKVLNAKRATRTAGSASQVWDRVERAAASMPVSRPSAPSATAQGVSKGKATMNGKGQIVPGAAFPSLASSSSSKAGASNASTTSAAARLAATTSVTSGSGYSSAAQPLIRSVHMPNVASSSNKPGRAPAPPSKSAFPSLPATSSTKERPNFARDEMVRRMKGDNSFVPPAGWQSPPEGGSTPVVEDEGEMFGGASGGGGGGGGGKKKKKGKEMLFTLGQARGM